MEARWHSDGTNPVSEDAPAQSARTNEVTTGYHEDSYQQAPRPNPISRAVVVALQEQKVREQQDASPFQVSQQAHHVPPLVEWYTYEHVFAAPSSTAKAQCKTVDLC